MGFIFKEKWGRNAQQVAGGTGVKGVSHGKYKQKLYMGQK
jgi:hypothetical protein